MTKSKSKNSNEERTVAVRNMVKSNNKNTTKVENKNKNKSKSNINIITLEEGWSIVYKGIVKLRNILEGVEGCGREFTGEEYINYYTIICNMCRQNPPHNYVYELFDLYKKSIQEYLTDTVLPALRRQRDGELMLRELARRWEIYKVMFRRLSHIFNYLDRIFDETYRYNFLTGAKYHLSTATMTCFQELIYQELRDNVMNSVIVLVDKERDGEQIDSALLRNVVHCILEIGHHDMDIPTNYWPKNNDYKETMFAATVDYYSRKAAAWSVEYSCPVYMLKVEQCLKLEKEVVAAQLLSEQDECEKLLKKVQYPLLFEYGIQVLEKECSGCHVLLNKEKIDDLSRMYRLFCEIPKALELIADTFGEHVTREGTALAVKVQQHEEKEQLAFVEKIIELHDKYSKYVEKVFQNNKRFDEVLHKALWLACSSTGDAGSRSTESLVAYCHNLLQNGGAKYLGRDDIEGTLETVVKILACVTDKVLMAEIYCQKLIHRLLFDTSANEDYELSTLSKLKQHCGQEYTSKMEGMLKDFSRSRNDQNIFKSYLNNNPNINLEIDFTVKVLTPRYWQRNRFSDINLPLELVKCVEVFENFYSTQTETERRKITWIYSLGMCDVIGWFETSLQVEMIVTTYQAAVLLLFNNSAQLNYSDIESQLNLPDADLVAVLNSLACGKYKILVKQPNNKIVTAADSFGFNHKFRSRKRRICVPITEVVEEKNVIDEHVEKKRRHVIDCYIVRIMKNRKVLLQQQLVNECIEQVRMVFKPEMEAIKERIEELIERDFLVRDEKDAQMLRYQPY